MKKLIKILVIILLIVLIVIGIKFLTQDKGAFEKTGNKIDKGLHKIGEKFNRQGPVEKTGQKIDQTFEKLGDKIEDLQKK